MRGYCTVKSVPCSMPISVKIKRKCCLENGWRIIVLHMGRGPTGISVPYCLHILSKWEAGVYTNSCAPPFFSTHKEHTRMHTPWLYTAVGCAVHPVECTVQPQGHTGMGASVHTCSCEVMEYCANQNATSIQFRQIHAISFQVFSKLLSN